MHPRLLPEDPAGEGRDEHFRGSLADSDVNTQAGLPQDLQAATGRMRGGIHTTDDHAAKAGCEQCVDTGRCSAVVRAGFECDENVSAGGLTGGCVYGMDFSVRTAGADVPAFSDEPAVGSNDDSADLRIGFDTPESSGRKFQGSQHDGFVRCKLHASDSGKRLVVCAKQFAEPADGSQITHSRRRGAQAKRRGDFAVAKMFEVPHHDDFPIAVFHLADGSKKAFLEFTAEGCGGRGEFVVSEQSGDIGGRLFVPGKSGKVLFPIH
jgi:hypothetical protein